MQGKYWLIVVSILASSAFGCKETNPYHCPEGENCPPAGGPCESSGECRAPTPVCNEVNMTCVECVANTDCAAARPVCNDQNTCVQCQVDDDCDSKLCLEGGACAAPEAVTYVGGPSALANALCTIDMPCQNLEQGLQGTALRDYIKVTGAVVEAGARTITKDVTIYGRAGAQISSSAAGEVLILKGMGAPAIRLVDLEIVGNAGSKDKDCVEIGDKAVVTMTRVNVHGHGQAGISLSGTAKLVMNGSQVHDNTLEGVNAAAGTTLELNRSLIYGNKGVAGVTAVNALMVTIDSSTIAANTGTKGGVSIEGPFSIRNSIIAGNGNVTTTLNAPGGLTLNPGTAANGKFEFNTVVDNASAATTTGLSCSGVAFEVSNSILTGNTVNCNTVYSLTDITGTPTGTNKIGDPMFVTKALLDPQFYRIGSMSAARDAADPNATLDVDIDGNPRSDVRKDMGADEFR